MSQSDCGNRPRVLFLFQLPPPVHGASMVNLSIKDSEYISSRVDARYVNISPAREMSDLGKLTISKFFSTIYIFIKCIFYYLKLKPSLVYMTLSPHGFAFWKDALILQVLKIFGAKTVVHLHGKGINSEVSGSKIKLYIYKAIFKGVDVIHLSKSLFSDINLVFDKNMSLTEVNNGVRDHGFIRNYCTKIPVFLYLSNLEPTKGADTLIEAINLLGATYEGKFKVKIVGKITNVQYNNNLIKLVDERLNKSIEFVGPLYGIDKHKVFLDSDVFVLPTRFRNECFPLSILEAMSYGLPVISTYEGAIPDIIDHGVTGHLFHSYDASMLATLITEYIDNPGIISKNGLNGSMKYKDKYTIKCFEQKFVSVIKSLT
ncbi:MAG: glycosyltransferase involved in cell wall biosynthesis [Motiliproteus sp.]|jgi:glycosyltransferase involved in cell wall biosynthesis